jgi:hypothetical protein
MLVLVVDDSADDELVSVLAAANMVPAHGYGGAWAAQVTPGVLTIKFTLVRLGGGWERAWTFPNPPDELLGPDHRRSASRGDPAARVRWRPEQARSGHTGWEHHY